MMRALHFVFYHGDGSTNDKLTVFVAFGWGLHLIVRALARIVEGDGMSSNIGIRLNVISVSYLRIASAPNILPHKRVRKDFKVTGCWIPFHNTHNDCRTQTITRRRRQHL